MLSACRQVNAMLSKPNVGHPKEFTLRDLISRLQDEYSYKENLILLDFIKNGVLESRWSLDIINDQLTLAYYMHEYIDIAQAVIDMVDEQPEAEMFIARNEDNGIPYAYSDGNQVRLSKTDKPTATTYKDYDIIPIKDIE
jgi:HEPN domain-containing protein